MKRHTLDPIQQPDVIDLTDDYYFIQTGRQSNIVDVDFIDLTDCVEQVTVISSTNVVKKKAQLPLPALKVFNLKPLYARLDKEVLKNKNIEDILECYYQIEKNITDVIKLESLEKQFNYMYDFVMDKYSQVKRIPLVADLHVLLGCNLNTLHSYKNRRNKEKNKWWSTFTQTKSDTRIDRPYFGSTKKKKLMTLPMIQNYIASEFSILLSMKQIYGIVNRLKGISLGMAKIQDKERDVDPKKLKKYCEDTPKIVDGVDPSLLFNIDESGFIPKVDSFNQVVAYDSNSDPKLIIQTDYSVRRITLLGGIAGDGTRINNFFIVNRDTTETEIKKTSFNFLKSPVVSQKNAFITRNLFIFWLNSVFKPELECRREYLKRVYCKLSEIELKEKLRAVLVMDGCTCHKGDSVINKFFDDNNVKVIYLPAHTSHVTQPLDVVIFGAAKKFIRVPDCPELEHQPTGEIKKTAEEHGLKEGETKDIDKVLKHLYDGQKITDRQLKLLMHSNQTKRLLAISKSFQKATSETNVYAAFNATGFIKTTNQRGEPAMIFDGNQSSIIVKNLKDEKISEIVRTVKPAKEKKRMSLKTKDVLERYGLTKDIFGKPN